MRQSWRKKGVIKWNDYLILLFLFFYQTSYILGSKNQKIECAGSWIDWIIFYLIHRKTLSDITPSAMNEMSDVELLCHAIHICGEDYLARDNSFLKMITFQKLAKVM